MNQQVIDRAAREVLIRDFLTAQGWDEADRRLLAGDASFRRYDRLVMNGRPAVLMDAPPPMENVAPFVKIGRLLHGMGFSAPEILAVDQPNGFVLLEDLGDDTYTRLLNAGHAEAPLYSLAVDALIELHRRLPVEALAALPEFDDARALREVSLVLDWYWPAIHGAPVAEDIRRDFEAAWRQVLPNRRAVPDSMALFDFHVDNMLLLPGRSGIKACGLLDFQDAVRAPITFDLVSLLEDVRRSVPPALMAAMIDRYLAANPQLKREDFMTAYAIIGAQRNTRIAGTFARLLKRDGKPAYQRFMPRVWELIALDLSSPALAPVAAWFEKHLPPQDRRSLVAA
jgi:aminoglycoside/choline kinase family phosphotransferase